MKNLLITGCSSGIGREAAHYFAEKGWTVYASVPSAADFELAAAGNSRVFPVEIDFLRPETIEKACEIIAPRLGEAGLHGLINNVGSVVAGPLEYMDEADFRRLMEINFWGHVRMIQTFLPHVRRAGGRIVNVSSTLGRVASPFHGPYAASKFALEAYSDALRMELKLCSDIKVVMINPGSTKTNVWRFLETDTERFFATAPAEAVSRYGQGFKQFRDTYMGFEKSSVHPVCVVKAMERALCARNPRIHYYPSLDTKIYNLLRYVPDKLRDRIAFRIIGLRRAE